MDDKNQISEKAEWIFQGEDSDIEVKDLMVNTNYGHNEEMLRHCKLLREYVWFVTYDE